VIRRAKGLTVRGGAAPVQDLEVVCLAENAILVQRELLARAELPLAGIAGEAGQVVHVVPRFAHPVARRDAAAALGALGAETSAPKQTDFNRIHTGHVHLFTYSRV